MGEPMLAKDGIINGAVNDTNHIDVTDRNSSTNSSNGHQNNVTETEFLIIGAGPSGAGLACFLASYGLKGIVLAAASGTANTPRAHITNMAAMECLRDVGLQREVDQVSAKEDAMVHTRWCYSMAGDEFARLFSWGHDPKRKGDYELASPCSPADVPQTVLEPLLIRYATHNGFKVRFDTTFLHFKEDKDTNVITVTVRDNLSGSEFDIRTKYLFGADGAQSRIVKQLELPLIQEPGQGLAINVLVKADLSHLMESRRGNLHWVMQPDREHPAFGWMGLARMVKPWDEWMFILLPKQDMDKSLKPTTEQYLAQVRDMIGDDTPAEILSVSRWYINDIVAQQYSQGNIFCLGDAVHRHPPFNGLGSNTCIQDAFNLAWKVAYVHRGLASPSLLSTYSVERQPVGAGIVKRANQAFREHFAIWEALGMTNPDITERRKTLQELSSPTKTGMKRRQDFQEAIYNTNLEFHGLGVEMGQHYSGLGIYDADESEPFRLSGRAAQNPVLYYEPNTYPGSRLPHVWLNTSVPTEPRSTIDIAGHGKFALFTGIGGEAWKTAARQVSSDLSIPITAVSIGFRQDWEDFYFEWQKLRDVQESGAVLVRPDRIVAWRSDHVLESELACTSKLANVMKHILGL